MVERVKGSGRQQNRFCVMCGDWIPFKMKSAIKLVNYKEEVIGFMCSIGCKNGR